MRNTDQRSHFLTVRKMGLKKEAESEKARANVT